MGEGQIEGDWLLVRGLLGFGKIRYFAWLVVLVVGQVLFGLDLMAPSVCSHSQFFVHTTLTKNCMNI